MKFDHCSKCGEQLEPIFPDQMRRATDFPQMRGALVVDFHGGYEMFMDDLKVRIILCLNCAIELLKSEPWLNTWFMLYSGNFKENNDG